MCMLLVGRLKRLLTSWSRRVTRWYYRDALKQMPTTRVADQLLGELESSDVPFEHWPASDELLRLYASACEIVQISSSFKIAKTDRYKTVPDQTQWTNDCWGCAHHDCGCGSPWYELVITERQEWAGYNFQILPVNDDAPSAPAPRA